MSGVTDLPFRRLVKRYGAGLVFSEMIASRPMIEEYARALDQSGADGVMIGRGAYGKPWVVRQIIDFLRNGIAGATPSLTEISALIQEHYDAILSYYGEYAGVRVARKHLGWYCEDYPGADALRVEINRMEDPRLIKERLRDYFYALNDNETCAGRLQAAA